MGFKLVIVELEALCLSSPSQTSRNASLKYRDLDLTYVQNHRVRYSSCMNTHKHKVKKRGRKNTATLAHYQHQNGTKQNEHMLKYIPTKYLDLRGILSVRRRFCVRIFTKDERIASMGQHFSEEPSFGPPAKELWGIMSALLASAIHCINRT